MKRTRRSPPRERTCYESDSQSTRTIDNFFASLSEEEDVVEHCTLRAFLPMLSPTTYVLVRSARVAKAVHYIPRPLAWILHNQKQLAKRNTE